MSTEEDMNLVQFFPSYINFIDRLGGIPLREITEICGPAGSGKTKLLHHLTVSFLCSNKDRVAYYYDIDNTFDSDYLLRVCRWLGCNPNDVLDRVFVQKYIDISGLNRSLRDLARESYRSNGLILIDSIPNLFVKELLFENEDDWPLEQLKLIVLLGEILVKMTKNFTIIVSNHVRSEIPHDLRPDISSIDNEQRDSLIPALGSVWEEFVDNRFFIKKIKRSLRLLIVHFSSSYPETFGLLKFRNELFM